MSAQSQSAAASTAVDAESEDVYFGSARVKIVGVRYYTGVISDGEQAVLRRDPTNQYDANAVQVNNVVNAKLGHIPKEIAAWMSPLLAAKRCTIQAVVPHRSVRDGYSITLDIHAFGPLANAGQVQAKLRTCSPHLLNYEYDTLAGPPQDWIAYSNALGAGAGAGGVHASSGAVSAVAGRGGALDVSTVLSKHMETLFADRIKYEDMPEAAQPVGITAVLYEHQRRAVWWMMERERHTSVAQALERQTAQAVASKARQGGKGSGPAMSTSEALLATIAARAVNVQRAYFWEKRANGRFFNTAAGYEVVDPGALPRGGILADEMGLGKTVTMLALIAAQHTATPPAPVAGHPTAAPRQRTLIVAPLSVLSVWREHLEGYTQPGLLSVYTHHGPSRLTSVREISGFDVVITSYATLESESDLSVLETAGAASSSSAAAAGAARQSPLQSIAWSRVVLDEAHVIKNKAARTSKACFGLTADVRWCLTGTPIQNKLDDLFSLVKFLRLKPFHEENWWKQLIVTPIRTAGNVEGFERLAGLLSTFCLRRTKEQRVGPEARPLLQLPPKRVHVIKVALRPSDRQAYDGLSRALKEAVHRLDAGTTDGRNLLGASADVFEVLMRLRQLACHSALVPPSRLAASLARAKEVGHATPPGRKSGGSGMDSALLAKLISALVAALEENQDCPICLDTFTEPVITLCAHLFCEECIQNVIAAAPLVSGRREAACPLCRGVIAEHSLSTLSALQSQSGLRGEREGEGEASSAIVAAKAAARQVSNGAGQIGSAKVDALIAALKVLISGGDAVAAASAASEPAVEAQGTAIGVPLPPAPTHEQDPPVDAPAATSSAVVGGAGRASKRKRGLPTLLAGEDGGAANSSAIVTAGVVAPAAAPPSGGGDGAPAPRRSGRAVRAPAHLSNALVLEEEGGNGDGDGDEYTEGKAGSKRKRGTANTRTAPSSSGVQLSGMRTKSVVFSQFTSLLDIIQDRLDEEGISWVRLDGGMTASTRQSACAAFQTDPTIHVFLVSTRAGGTGLTLTAASNVFVMDPSYNPAASDQAVDRCHRLGQSAPVDVHHLVSADTVEEAILELQVRKRGLAAAALAGAKREDIARHRLNDLRLLVGT